MQLSNEDIQKMKDLLEKEGGKEITWNEASDSAYRLSGLFELLYKGAVEDEKRKQKLKEFPKGFTLDGIGYSCFICGSGTPASGNWYDKYGIKCMICQGAIDRKEIPGSLAKNKESWYSKYELESRFNIKGPTLKNWIKQGILKARNVSHNGIGVHVQLFLIKDNEDVLPPKKLTESKMVAEEKDGKTWHRMEPWYRFVDPYVHLKGYKIMGHLKFTTPENNKEK